MLRVITFILVAVFATSMVAADEVSYTGEFLSGRIAVGGETTGFALRYRAADGSAKTIDLEIKPDMARPFKSGARVRVTGTLTQREYVERGSVEVLLVRTIAAAE